MYRTVLRILLGCGLLAGAAFGQRGELGILGGAGFSPGFTLQGRAATAGAGFRNGGVVGAYLGDNTYQYWSGEIRYLYRMSNMRLSAGGVDTEFGAHTQIVHMDVLAHFQPRDARVRVFVAFGGGVKVIRGTGMETSAQPLSQFAALTKTRQVLPTGDAGFGVKVNLRRHLRARFEVRDYISPQPDKMIAAAPGVSLGGVLHDILALAALSYTW